LPAAVIVLGGALSRALREGEEKITLSNVLQALRVIFSRFVIVPVCALGALRGFERLGLLTAQDSMARMIVLMTGCAMPSPIIYVAMLRIAGQAKGAGRAAKMLAVQYMMALVPMALSLSWVLRASGIAI